MNSLTGRTFGKYYIMEKIREGGMSSVYKAYQPGLDRYVAVKILPPFHAERADFGRRFESEAKVIASIHHPNILPVYDYGQHDGYSFIVMRYIQGTLTLKEFMETPLSLERITDLMVQISAALDHAHQEGVIHRDVKPSNVLLDGEWALLTDFGLAKMTEASVKLTPTGVGIGTPAYMSPEQGQGLKVCHRTDIYSLGVILFEMLTGRIPHNAETPFAIVLKRATEPLPLPSASNSEISEAVERVVLKALAPDPDDRYQSAGALAEALGEAVEGSAVAESPKPSEVMTDKTGIVVPRVRQAPAFAHGIPRHIVKPLLLMAAAAVMLIVVAAVALGSFAIGRGGKHASASSPPTIALQTRVLATEQAPGTGSAVFPDPPSAALPLTDPIIYTVDDGGSQSLYATDRSGSGPFLLVSGGDRVSGRFCPYGQYVLVELQRSGKRTLYVMRADGSHPQVLSSDLDDGWAYCSDDGEKVWAAGRKEGVWDAVVMDADGSNSIALVSGVADYDVSWDEGWQKVATSLKEGDQYALYVTSGDRETRQDVTRGKNASYSYSPELSATGQWLLYRTYEDETFFNLYLVNTESGQSTELATQVVYPQGWFSPSGENLLVRMMSTVDRPYDLYAYDIAGGEMVQLLSGDEVGGRFSPDGQWIIAHTRREGMYHLHIFSADGARQWEAVAPGTHAVWGRFSEDGQWVTASTRREGVYHLYLFRVDGTEKREIVGGGESVDWYAEATFSPDSQHLLLHLGRAAPPRSSLYLVTADGSEWIELARDADWQLSAAFTCDGQHIVFDSNREGQRAVYTADARGNHLRRVALGYRPRVTCDHSVGAEHSPPPPIPDGEHAMPPRPTPAAAMTAGPAQEPTSAERSTLPPTSLPVPTLTLEPNPTRSPTQAPEPMPTLGAAPSPTSAPVPYVVLRTSAPPGSSASGQSVNLGLRNEQGVAGRTYAFQCTVYAPDGAQGAAHSILSGDEWAYLLYPDDFAGASSSVGGEYQLICWVEGHRATDRFTVDEQMRIAEPEDPSDLP